jgi:membrane protein implicated in regulation of membrane protease activity
MEGYSWIVWAIFGVILIIAEVFTPGFVLLWFGVGALAAAFLGLLGVGIPLQILTFVVVSVALIAMSRTIFVNYFSREHEDGDLKSGVDAIPGQVVTVVSGSVGSENAAEVKLFGSVWVAFPADGESPLKAGERVEVQRVQGASLYVRRVGDLPEWRQKSAIED